MERGCPPLCKKLLEICLKHTHTKFHLFSSQWPVVKYFWRELYIATEDIWSAQECCRSCQTRSLEKYSQDGTPVMPCYKGGLGFVRLLPSLRTRFYHKIHCIFLLMQVHYCTFGPSTALLNASRATLTILPLQQMIEKHWKMLLRCPNYLMATK